MVNKDKIRELIVLIFQFMLFYFLSKKFWSNEAWAKDKIKELIFFILSSAIITFLGIVFNSFCAPITFHITQKNKEFKVNQTNFFLKGKAKTSESARTVQLKITIEKKYSVWSILVLNILKNINYSIEFKSESEGLKLQLVNDINLNHENSIIKSTMDGIEIDMGKYISNELISLEQGTVSREFEYIINEDRDNFSTTGTYTIVGKNNIDGLKSKFMSILIKSNIEQHSVNFVRR